MPFVGEIENLDVMIPFHHISRGEIISSPRTTAVYTQTDAAARQVVLFFFQSSSPAKPARQRLFLDNGRHETLGVLDVDSLDVAVELLLGTLLVVTAAADAHTDSVGDTLDTLLPDLLVELGVDADIGGTLLPKLWLVIRYFVVFRSQV